ncbi:hypothetical protein HIM_10055 [Hirsutella minnesotensis 3608]|uniref:Uncharacterized protein n=1 Tax=Hirsutella minnesotensis 3608 TaxID=1043627 RepID=A0A0F7ZXD9_9HYPO|nr:hypothetical protein HIM_10055 [Hirsutella minnesotensis 3608]
MSRVVHIVGIAANHGAAPTAGVRQLSDYALAELLARPRSGLAYARVLQLVPRVPSSYRGPITSASDSLLAPSPSGSAAHAYVERRPRNCKTTWSTISFALQNTFRSGHCACESWGRTSLREATGAVGVSEIMSCIPARALAPSPAMRKDKVPVVPRSPGRRAKKHASRESRAWRQKGDRRPGSRRNLLFLGPPSSPFQVPSPPPSFESMQPPEHMHHDNEWQAKVCQGAGSVLLRIKLGRYCMVLCGAVRLKVHVNMLPNIRRADCDTAHLPTMSVMRHDAILVAPFPLPRSARPSPRSKTDGIESP